MPTLSPKVKHLLAKSRDSALLAVDVYNKPATKFRSYAYIVLMVIAWTSLLHSVFERRKVKYFYRKRNSSRYEYIDGDRKAWDISKCVEEYFRDQSIATRKNLEFFIGLRNKIEHRFLPALDIEIIGECHSLLSNFERILVKEFGEKHSLNESLAIPLQLLTIDPAWRMKTLKELQAREYELVRNYIHSFRASLDAETESSLEYSFRVFLIPKIGNHESSSDIAIEFVKYNPDKPEEMQLYESLVALVKEKRVEIPVFNSGALKPGDVCKRVEQSLGIRFAPATHHVSCWKHDKVRPERGSKTPEFTNPKYCHYDAAHKDYVYTEDWVKFLIQELSDANRRQEILGL
jgi:hypothetical protein